MATYVGLSGVLVYCSSTARTALVHHAVQLDYGLTLYMWYVTPGTHPPHKHLTVYSTVFCEQGDLDDVCRIFSYLLRWFQPLRILLVLRGSLSA